MAEWTVCEHSTCLTGCSIRSLVSLVIDFMCEACSSVVVLMSMRLARQWQGVCTAYDDAVDQVHALVLPPDLRRRHRVMTAAAGAAFLGEEGCVG